MIERGLHSHPTTSDFARTKSGKPKRASKVQPGTCPLQ
jgi:hypothetical protein